MTGPRIGGLLTVVTQAVCGGLSLRHYAALPLVEARPWPADAPARGVSVIVPARNEEATLGRLLASLGAQDYPDLEVVVVDDRSTDRTARIARGFHGVRLVEGTEPPPGWTGKAHACAQGAAAATGDWLLFVDADTAYAPTAVSSAVAYATERRLDFLSLFLQQECGSFWERLLLPYAYALYFTGVDAARVSSPDYPLQALANGQFMLFRRQTYQAVGGHGAVRSSVIDDVEMALVLKRQGVAMAIGHGEALGRVRMYQGLASLWEGFVKNSFSFVRVNPRGAPAVVGGTIAVGGALPLLWRSWRDAAMPEANPKAGGNAIRWRGAVAPVTAAVGCALPAALLAPWYRRFGVAAGYALLHPLAFVVFQSIALTSGWRTLTQRGVTWKGRTYGATRRRYYRLPRRQLAELGLDMVTNGRRLLADDGARLMASLPNPPRVEGDEHIPVEGPFCIAANHYQRWGLWIGWEGGLLAAEVARRRPRNNDLRLVVIANSQLTLLGRSFTVPGTALLYERVARVWGMVPLPGGPGEAAGRARALRRLMSLALPRDGGEGQPIGLFPEGELGSVDGLRPALPGVGAFFLLLGRRGVPALPAAMWEDDQGLVARFGPPLVVTAEGSGPEADRAAARQVMRRIAALLPESLQGDGASE